MQKFRDLEVGARFKFALLESTHPCAGRVCQKLSTLMYSCQIPEDKVGRLYHKVISREGPMLTIKAQARAAIDVEVVALAPVISPAMLNVLDLANSELKARGASGCYWQLIIAENKGRPVHRMIMFEHIGVNAGAPLICEMIEAETSRAMYNITRSLSRYHARRTGDGWRY